MYEISAGEGKHRVWLKLWDTGQGWTGSLTGGETPHVGGIVLAVPRASLTGCGLSCDIWAVPAPGHLDHEAAVPIAKQLCVRLEVTVALAAGIHIERAAAWDIAQVRENCEAALAEFWRSLKQE